MTVDEVRVLSAGAAEGFLRSWIAANPEFKDVLKCKFGPVGIIRDMLKDGEPCDLMITSTERFGELVAVDGLVEDSRHDLGRVDTAIGVQSASGIEAISDEDSVRDRLVAATRVHHSDPVRSTAGRHFFSVLESLGILNDLQDRLVVHESGSLAMKGVASDESVGAVGCSQSTEIAITAGVRPLGVLPGRFALSTVYLGAVASNASNPSAARELVEIFGGPTTEDIRTAVGFSVG